MPSCSATWISTWRRDVFVRCGCTHPKPPMAAELSAPSSVSYLPTNKARLIEEFTMLTLWGPKRRSCVGIGRRDFLKLGALGFGGLSLPDLLRQEARGNNAGRPKSIIYVV